MSQSRPENAPPPHDPREGPTLRNWEKPPAPIAEQMTPEAWVDMGWGRLIFGQTFQELDKLVGMLLDESRGHRDIAFYLRDPHVVLAMAPDRLFLDPSHTYRLYAHDYKTGGPPPPGLVLRRLETLEDAQACNRIFGMRGMVKADPQFMVDQNTRRRVSYFVAETTEPPEIVGTITGVDHVEVFNDPEQGSSFWCLAVDPQTQTPGVGQALVRQIIEHYFARGRAYVDLSVMHDNEQAIALYDRLGFKRVPVFCVKRRNPINEPLFTPPQPEEKLNPYAKIIVNEARRRGIAVEVLDEEGGFFRLSWGGRSITCRESLSELTTSIAMSRCDDKRVTRRILEAAGVRVPEQQLASQDAAENEAFLAKHERLVVKPARGEQGRGITVDVREPNALEAAIDAAEHYCEDVILEQFVAGEDLRVIVINHEVVAAAVRKPAELTGTGKHTILELLEKYNRRRRAATGGESAVPIDAMTHQCVADAGYTMDDTLPMGETLRVRKTANLHTGGTIHDVTEQLHPELIKASILAADALEIPVTGLDLLVPSVEEPEYVMIEANERPGLANHEPAPTAERFIDFLFPQTVSERRPRPLSG